MAQRETLASLEDKIALFPGRKDHETILQGLISDQARRRPLMIAWCILNGITTRSANAAMNPSLAKAYAIPSYLSTWRARDNPAFSALHDGIDFGEDQAETPEAAPRGAPMDIAADTAERMAGAVAPLIKRLVAVEVANAMYGAKLELSEASKQKIRDIAREGGIAGMVALGEKILADVREELDRRIPPQEIRVTNTETKVSVNLGIQHEKFPILLRACQARNSSGHRLNIWLTGPTGSGKTTAGENVGKALNLTFEAESSLDADYKVMGYFNAQGVYIETAFYRRFKHGGVIVLDEIDNWHPSALLSVNSAMANGWAQFPCGMVQRHPNCVIIACANTWGLGATNDYVGRSKLDAASLDRFMPKIDWNIDERLELAIARNMNSTFGSAWCEFVQLARRKAQAQGLKIVISPRATINGIALIQAGFNSEEVQRQTFLAGLSDQQVRALNLPTLAWDINAETYVTRDDDATEVFNKGFRKEFV